MAMTRGRDGKSERLKMNPETKRDKKSEVKWKKSEVLNPQKENCKGKPITHCGC
jgi:hypothetical protein